jgi:CHAT domain-containing protein/tetratricopeptide (TPR) repeat protein
MLLPGMERLKQQRKFAELTICVNEVLGVLGPLSGKGDTHAMAVGLVASFGAFATYELGRYTEMSEFAEIQVRAGQEIPAASVTLVRGLNWRALAEEAQGRVATATVAYEEGLAIAERLDPPSPDDEGVLRMNYADLLMKRDNETALVDHLTRLPLSPGPITDLAAMNLTGVNSFAAGRLDDGVAVLLEVKERALAAGDNRSAGVAASNIGQAFTDAGRPEVGVVYLMEAQELLRHPGMGEQLGTACHNLGLTYWKLGDDEKAGVAFKEGWEALRTEAPRSLLALSILTALALHRFTQGDHRRARAALARGLELYESIRPDVGWNEREHEGMLRAYRNLIELHLILSLADGWVDETLALIDRGKARFWAESLSDLGAGEDSAQIIASRPTSGIIEGNLPITARGGCVLSFFVGSNMTFIASGTAANPQIRRIGVGEDALRELVEGMTFDLLASPSRSERRQHYATRLAELLLDDFDPKDTRALFILPDGPLWALPFGALPLPGTPGYLGDQVPILIAPALQVLQLLHERFGRPPEKDSWQVVALGAPAAGAGFPPIGGTAEQVAAIAGLFPGMMPPLTGAAATRRELSSRITTATHVHLAAHAFGSPDDDSPYIVLSDGRDGPDLLYATEIAQWRLRAELVFLSACSTSVGRLSPGEGLMSIGRAFVLAGARCVITTLWPIEDAASVELVSYFYRRLRSGAPPARAAHDACMEARRHGASPRIWSALQVIGDGLVGENTIKLRRQ